MEGIENAKEVMMPNLLDSLVTEYLEYLEIEKNRSPLTILCYRHYLQRFCNWLSENFSAIKPEDITLEIVRNYRLYLAHLRNRNGTQLKPITQTYHIIALRALLRYLLIQRDIPTLSPDKIELPKNQSSHSIVFLSLEQIKKLLDSPKISNNSGWGGSKWFHLILRDKAILETLFSAGLRVSELINLNREQIDLKRREFSVKGKGNKLRIVFLSEAAAQWIERYLLTREDNFKPLFIRYSGVVNARNNGEKMRLTARSIQKIVEKYAQRAGLPIEVTPHTLRHSFATDLLINGADIRSVQEMLGHESVRTTQIYTHITNGHLKEVHKAFHSSINSQIGNTKRERKLKGKTRY
jgi:site-specific recombinase XerD